MIKSHLNILQHGATMLNSDNDPCNFIAFVGWKVSANRAPGSGRLWLRKNIG